MYIRPQTEIFGNFVKSFFRKKWKLFDRLGWSKNGPFFWPIFGVDFWPIFWPIFGVDFGVEKPRIFNIGFSPICTSLKIVFFIFAFFYFLDFWRGWKKWPKKWPFLIQPRYLGFWSKKWQKTWPVLVDVLRRPTPMVKKAIFKNAKNAKISRTKAWGV